MQVVGIRFIYGLITNQMPIDMFLARIKQKGIYHLSLHKNFNLHLVAKAANFQILIEVLIAVLMVKNYFNVL